MLSSVETLPDSVEILPSSVACFPVIVSICPLIVSMAEVALSWLMSKVASPVVGVTKLSQIDALAKASDLKLKEEENTYLEELYVPHQLVGVMSWYK